ncbi:hypothetical protein H5J22_12130 [Cetobacterium sp. 8H]|uniref:hypothetical protein n=1 Tax=Cetobacterium sp. 8H TaxID=2759681 RepID=UPI00163CD8F4|nr:hypothetical protein [Cetobacterium sp. 8H]MBC2852146.1 hypothetical protein [Cetobacterium sp. 8H]
MLKIKLMRIIGGLLFLFLSASGNRGITKVYPHTPGIAAAISVYKLIVKGEVKPEDGEILVTGVIDTVGGNILSTAIKSN